VCRCRICGPISHNEAELSVSFGKDDTETQVCRWCSQDLSIFGVKVNQTVRLTRPIKRVAFFFLGPVRSLFWEAKA
jgi:hypothetical protein